MVNKQHSMPMGHGSGQVRPWHAAFPAKHELTADSRLAPSQWETWLQSNAVSHWLGANLESVLTNSSIPRV